MRVDGNTMGKPVYWPNSYQSKAPAKGTAPSFDPSVVEQPMQFASNVLSRKGHYRHEGHPSEYDQVRELYQRVLSVEERNNLHSNTGRLLKVADNIVIKNYLIQLHAIDPLYAEGVWNALPKERQDKTDFTWAEVEEASKTAHLVGKNVSARTSSLLLSHPRCAVADLAAPSLLLAAQFPSLRHGRELLRNALDQQQDQQLGRLERAVQHDQVPDGLRQAVERHLSTIARSTTSLSPFTIKSVSPVFDCE